MQVRRRGIGRIATAASLIALAGCASATGGSRNATVEASTSSGASAASSSTTPAGKADPVLTPDGIGPVKFGMGAAQAGKLLGAPLGPPNERCQESTAMPDVDFVVVDGTVAAAGSYTPRIPPEHLRTDKGISMQSTRDQLLAAYPTDMTSRASSGDAYTTLYTWTAPNGRVVQFTVNDQILGIFAGDADITSGEELCAG